MGRLSHRTFIVSSAAALVILVAVVGIAQARMPLHPPFPATCTAGIMADGTTVNTVNVNVDPTKLRTKDPVEAVQACNVGGPGWSSGWHHHAGPVIVNVTSGALTFYSPTSCSGTKVRAGQAYIETAGNPILDRNESVTKSVTWTTTQIIPVGAELYYAEPSGYCGVS